MPSLKPKRLRGVDCDVEVVDVRPKPSCDQRTDDRAEADAGQVAHGVHGDLRVVGAGLDAEVAAGPRRVEEVAREVRQLAQRVGLPVGDAEAVAAVGVAEQRRAEAEGDRQAARRQVERLAGVVGRQAYVAVDGAGTRGLAARSSARRRAVHRSQQVDELVARSR